jgi:hypothetical protein
MELSTPAYYFLCLRYIYVYIQARLELNLTYILVVDKALFEEIGYTVLRLGLC